MLIVILCISLGYLVSALIFSLFVTTPLSTLLYSGNVVVTGVWSGYFLACYLISRMIMWEDELC